MSGTGSRTSGRLFGLYLVASVAVAVVAGVVAVNRAAQRPPSAPTSESSVALLAPPGEPIRAEAEVFRTHAGVTAIPPAGERKRDAHPRTLARFRFLRAYPGAPPRIPHGFTADEFRTGACNTCHQRGGYSPRFDAYVPLTPHPEMPACLQCHVGRDEVTGVSLPSLDPSTVCRQCHVPGAARWQEALVDWRPMAWPSRVQPAEKGVVPSITHDLFFRGNCLACHSGPSSVAEIRTTHPERANCRQCHVLPDPAVDEFTRPVPAVRGPVEGS
jgi:cytochrome c-type protein NapB